ncbi:hypothetical protein LSAT2_017133 [Lamellibrachia satsuma]|nr:hypothetical protein LSAT2_017133 [Lamellibrachia satsuma]
MFFFIHISLIKVFIRRTCRGQGSRNHGSSTDSAQGGSTNPVGVKSLQGHMRCIPSQYITQRSNDSMDIYVLQRQGYSSDDEAQYRQFMYKQWKNKQKNLIAELNERSTHRSPARDAEKETTNLVRAYGANVTSVWKPDSNSNARDEDDAFEVDTFAVLGRALFNDHPHLNYDDFLNGGGIIDGSNIWSNRRVPDNRTQPAAAAACDRFIWHQAREDGANSAAHEPQPGRRDKSDDIVASTSAFGGARARNKNPSRKKTDECPTKPGKTRAETSETVERRETVSGSSTRKQKPQRPSSAVPENVSTTSEMTSAKAPTSCADKKGGNKTSRNKCSSRKDSGIKQKRVRRKHDETGDSSQTTTVGDSSTPTATLDCSTPTATLKSPRTARRRQEGAKTTSDITFSGTSVTFELTDTPSCHSSVSMTSSMASDIINREMENLDLLSGSSSAESTLSDVLRGLDVRAVIANANKFGRRHLTNGDFDKWLDVGTKLAFLQNDDPAFAPDAASTTSCSWMPTTTIQSASASALLPGRTRLPGNRAKRACAAIDDLYAKKRSKGTSTTYDIDSLPYSHGYSDWSTSSLLATSQLISQSDTSVSSSLWSRT